MALKVPERYIPMLNAVRNLSESAASELVRALEAATLTSSHDEMTEQIADKVPSIPKEELRNIVNVIYSLYHVREFSELNRNSFLDELIDSLREHADPKISAEELPAIRKRFKGLLSIKSLEGLSKAVALQREGERLYGEAKIISDIRPVFGDDVEARPVAAVITHTLKIEYHENDGHKNFFIALDEYDLDDLEQIIKRAKAKAKTLTGVLADSEIPRLGI
jgi:hypothetical protein